MKKVYFDNAATTPVRQEVLAAMEPYFSQKFGNPSSVHSFGQEVLKAVEKARRSVQQLLNAVDEREIIFTSGGTEADNFAIIGAAMANRQRGRHIISSNIEHHAVLHTLEYLEQNLDFEVTYLEVDNEGLVSVEDFKNAIRKDTILASVMMANNEIGTIQPLKKLAEIAKKHNILFHTDGVQAVGTIPVDVQDLNVDMLSLSGHKMNGPKGVGALYLRRGVKIHSHMHGGAQEYNKRGGTHNAPGIIGLGKACELALKELPGKMEHLQKLRDKMIAGIEQKIPHLHFNGHRQQRLPGNVSFCFSYIEGESLLLSLDLKGIAASSGSACTSGLLDPSHVLLAIGHPHEIAHGSLRLSLGIFNTSEEVDYLLEVLPGIVMRLREMSPIYPD